MNADFLTDESPSDYDLVTSLHRAGLPEFGFEFLNSESLRFSSASALADSLIEKNCQKATSEQIDSVHLAIRILWNRWFPERASFEIVNEWMQSGYDASGENDPDGAVDCWFQAWRFIWQLSAAWQLRSIREFDREASTLQSLHNWMYDFLDEFGKIVEPDRESILRRVTLCQQMNELAAESEDHQTRIQEFLEQSLQKLAGTREESLQSARDAEVDAIVSELNRPFDGQLPELAIREAQRNRERISSRLIELVNRAAEAARADDFSGDYDGVLIALFLLAEFESKETLPALLELLSLPDDRLDLLLGDAITESLSLFLSVMADPQSRVVDDLISNRQLNEYVRWEVAHTLMHWVRLGKITREAAAARLCEHLLQACENRDGAIAGPLVCELDNYAMKESLPTIEQAYSIGLVNSMMISLDDVRESLTDPDAYFQKRLNKGRSNWIVDTVQSLGRWASYQPEEPRAPVVSVPSPSPQKNFTDPLETPASFAYSGTIRNTTEPISRNDPCPCNSGKKYKKCCMRGEQ